jgi:xylulokinase
MGYVLGCDIGSQGVKALLLSEDGKVLGEASAGYAIEYPQPTWADQPVDRWLTALHQAIPAVCKAAGIPPDQIRAIGLDAQVDGVVPIDSTGAVLRPAIIWMDRRAVAQCDSVAARHSASHLFDLSGLNLDPSHVAPKIRWLAENDPATYEKAQHFLLPCSYVGYYLTGEIAVDYANASSSLLMDVRTREWSAELCQAFDIPVERLAPILPANAVLGRLKKDIAERLNLPANIPVTVGTGDEHAACLGAGVVRSGLVCDIAGTAEPVCAAASAPSFDPTGLVETHCHADPDLWLLENPGFVSGANYRWFRDQFARTEVRQAAEQGLDPYNLLNEAADQVPPGSEGLLMLPCLMGAMAPTWNAHARGTFFGFTLAHRREHFVRAVLEASAYAVRDITDQMKQIGLALQEIRVVGGGARSKLWRQIKADVTGLPTTVLQTAETTALGAAMLALHASGMVGSLEQAVDRVVQVVETLEPRPAEQSHYEDYYQLYRATYFSLLPVFEQAARIAS